SFEEIVEKLEEFKKKMVTFFVLDNLDILKKNGRLTGVKSLVASTLNIKPIMQGEKGAIAQAGQAVGIKKALSKMTDLVVEKMEKTEERILMITHCNNLKRAEAVRDMILAKAKFKAVNIMDTAGISSLYAADGGIIVTV
ncbi:MAG: DegV family protein, partial [Lachnospiraceae bacterium]